MAIFALKQALLDLESEGNISAEQAQAVLSNQPQTVRAVAAALDLFGDESDYASLKDSVHAIATCGAQHEYSFQSGESDAESNH